MRVLAALLVVLSFFATHGAGAAFERTSTLTDQAATNAASPVDLPSITAADCCPDEARATIADDQPCQNGDCLFIVPAVAAAMHVARPGMGRLADETGAGKPGRMVHPPPIS